MSFDFEVFPKLESRRLTLVEIQQQHISDLFDLFSDASVTAFYHVIPIETKEDLLPVVAMFKARYLAKTAIRWGISLRGHEGIIGTIGFSDCKPGHKATLIYALMPAYWGQGFITEAITEVLKFGFEQLKVQRIEAEVLPGNIASEKVLAKMGFTYEGLLRQWAHWRGRNFDIKMYSVLPAPGLQVQ